MSEDTVLETTVRDWQLGTSGEDPTLRLTVVSAKGNRTVIGEIEASPGTYHLTHSPNTRD